MQKPNIFHWIVLTLTVVIVGLFVGHNNPETWFGQVMKSNTSNVAYVVLVVVVVLLARRVKLMITGPLLAKRGREFWFTVSPAQCKVVPTPEFPFVFGVLMDWPINGVRLTVIAVADGTSSLYTSRSVAIMGGLAASEAAKQFVRQAESSLQFSTSVTGHPYPPADSVRFYIRTYDGLRMIEEKISALKSGTSKHTGLFTAANCVITELRQAAAKVAKGEAQSNELKTLSDEFESLYQQGLFDRAIVVGKKTLEVAEQSLGPDHPDVATSLDKLAAVYHAQGQYAQAEPLGKRALAILEKALGPEHPDVGGYLNNLAAVYHAQGQYAQAEPLLKRALAILEKALGPEHPVVATNLNNLAWFYQAQGQYAQAEPLGKRALAITERALGPEHPDVATSLTNLAAVYHAQGQYAQAEPLFQRALTIREKALGPEHPDVAGSLNNLAAVYATQGQYAQAEPFLKRALTINEKTLGPEHLDVATGLENIAMLYLKTGRENQAKALQERAEAIRSIKR